VVWSFDPANAAAHAVADASGLSLFGSGDEPAGGRFTFAFLAAGSYAFASRDVPPEPTGEVDVPVALSAARAVTDAPVAVTWAVVAPPPGLVCDVQVLRVSGAWAGLRHRRAATDATFRAPAPGSYGFRARVRDPATGTATGWSPTAWLTVLLPASRSG
jgi:hypothetical protein